MIVLRRRLYAQDQGRRYELQIGWASWNRPGDEPPELAIRMEIRNQNGRFLRSSPEVPLSWPKAMLEFMKEAKAAGLMVPEEALK